jgi:RNA polymerase sigma-70 factor (ECF subfamily)
MIPEDTNTEDLLSRAGQGDGAALEDLLGRHRDRLLRMVAIRIDRRLAPRVDASDVVQEALADAAHKLPAYLSARPLPFYPWLRQLALERLLKIHRHHLGAHKRSVLREQAGGRGPCEDSACDLAQLLVDSITSPSDRVVRAELCARVQAVLGGLALRDREVLVLRYFQQLSTSEIAAALGITEEAVKGRHVRALERLRDTFGLKPSGENRR